MKQKPSKPPRDRAIGVVGPGVVKRLEEAGLILMDREALDKLYAELDRLKGARRG